MAEPKRKTSKRRRDNRRAHSALVKATLIKCEKCGNMKKPHTICKKCSNY